jgi:hypothetical protein
MIQQRVTPDWLVVVGLLQLQVVSLVMVQDAELNPPAEIAA